MREPGRSVPPELLPEVSAGIRVVCVDGDGLVEPPGELARGLNVAPSALPRLQATADGGLVVGYRVHRQLPLMTYYWEAAAQVLGPDGWCPPITFGGTDATLEEVSLAATADRGRAGHPGRRAAAARPALDRGVRRAGVPLPRRPPRRGDLARRARRRPGGARRRRVRGPAAIGGRPVGAARLRRPAGGAALGRWAERAASPTGCGSARRPTSCTGATCTGTRWSAAAPPVTSPRWRTSTATPGTSTSTTSGRSPTTPRTPPPTSGGASRRSPTCCTCPAASCRSTGSSGPRPTRPPERHLRRRRARSPDLLRFRRGLHHPGRALARAGRPPASSRRSPSRTTPARPWCTTTGTTTIPRFSRLVEVFQACRGNYESDGCFRQYSDGTATGTFMLDGLRRGHRFGLIASSDHGHGASYVAVLARSLSRAGDLRRLCGRAAPAPPTTRGVLAVLRLGPHLMGDERRLAGPGRCGARPRLHRARPGRHPARRPDRAHACAASRCWRRGHRRVDLRVEWGQADTTTRWDGRLSVEGGRLVLPDYVGPEVVAMDSRRRARGSTSRTASASPTARSAVASRSASAARTTRR